jgi:glycosyltransferase involved in cell wall biosynthesis
MKKISVIVPAYNEGDGILDLIESVEADAPKKDTQYGARIRLVCAVNEGEGADAEATHSNEITARLITNRTHPNVEFVLEDRFSRDKRPQVSNVGKARNWAAERAHGLGSSLLVNTDADSRLLPGYFRACEHIFDENSPVIAASGPVYIHTDRSNPDEIHGNTLDGLVWTMHRIFEQMYYTYVEPSKSRGVVGVSGANIVVRANTWAANPFPETGSGEDVSFMYNLLTKGLITYDQALRVSTAARFSSRIPDGGGFGNGLERRASFEGDYPDFPVMRVETVFKITAIMNFIKNNWNSPMEEFAQKAQAQFPELNWKARSWNKLYKNVANYGPRAFLHPEVHMSVSKRVHSSMNRTAQKAKAPLRQVVEEGVRKFIELDQGSGWWVGESEDGKPLETFGSKIKDPSIRTRLNMAILHRSSELRFFYRDLLRLADHIGDESFKQLVQDHVSANTGLELANCIGQFKLDATTYGAHPTQSILGASQEPISADTAYQTQRSPEGVQIASRAITFLKDYALRIKPMLNQDFSPEQAKELQLVDGVFTYFENLHRLENSKPPTQK